MKYLAIAIILINISYTDEIQRQIDLNVSRLHQALSEVGAPITTAQANQAIDLIDKQIDEYPSNLGQNGEYYNEGGTSSYEYAFDASGEAFLQGNLAILEGMQLTAVVERSIEKLKTEDFGNIYQTNQEYVASIKIDPLNFFAIDTDEWLVPLGLAIEKGTRFTVNRVFKSRIDAISAPPIFIEFFLPGLMGDRLQPGDSLRFTANSAFVADTSIVQNLATDLVLSGFLKSGGLSIDSSLSYALTGLFDVMIVKVDDTHVKVVYKLAREESNDFSVGLKWSLKLLELPIPYQELRPMYEKGPTLNDLGIDYSPKNFILKKGLEMAEKKVVDKYNELKKEYLPEEIQRATRVLFDTEKELEKISEDLTGIDIFGSFDLLRYNLNKLRQNFFVMDMTFDLENIAARKAYRNLFGGNMFLMDSAILSNGEQLEKLRFLQNQKSLLKIVNEDLEKEDKRVSLFMGKKDRVELTEDSGLDLLFFKSDQVKHVENEYITVSDSGNLEHSISHLLAKKDLSQAFVGDELLQDEVSVHGYFDCDVDHKVRQALGYQLDYQITASAKVDKARYTEFLKLNIPIQEALKLNKESISEIEAPLNIALQFVLNPNGLKYLSNTYKGESLKNSLRDYLESKQDQLKSRLYIEGLFNHIESKGATGWLVKATHILAKDMIAGFEKVLENDFKGSEAKSLGTDYSKFYNLRFSPWFNKLGVGWLISLLNGNKDYYFLSYKVSQGEANLLESSIGAANINSTQERYSENQEKINESYTFEIDSEEYLKSRDSKGNQTRSESIFFSEELGAATYKSHKSLVKDLKSSTPFPASKRISKNIQNIEKILTSISESFPEILQIKGKVAQLSEDMLLLSTESGESEEDILNIINNEVLNKIENQKVLLYEILLWRLKKISEAYQKKKIDTIAYKLYVDNTTSLIAVIGGNSLGLDKLINLSNIDEIQLNLDALYVKLRENFDKEHIPIRSENKLQLIAISAWYWKGDNHVDKLLLSQLISYTILKYNQLKSVDISNEDFQIDFQNFIKELSILGPCDVDPDSCDTDEDLEPDMDGIED